MISLIRKTLRSLSGRLRWSNNNEILRIISRKVLIKGTILTFSTITIKSLMTTGITSKVRSLIIL